MNWWIILLAIIAGTIGLLYYTGILGPVLFALALLTVAFLFYKKCIKKLDPYQAALIYRFGRYHRTSPAGWTIVLPIIEKMGAIVDMREWQDHIPIQAITKEGLKVNLYALSYSFVTNAKKAVLNIENYRLSLASLIESRVRDIAGDFSFTQLFVNVEDVSALLHQQLNTALDNWGIALNMFEIERIQPPEEVMQAISGVKVAEETLAAKRFAAEARRVLVNALGEGTRNFDDKTTAYLYIKALENMKSAKMMMPAEFMDVISPGKMSGRNSNEGNNNLVKGMVAGTTFNKAMGMIGDIVTDEAKLPEQELEKIVATDRPTIKINSYHEDEAAMGAYDSLDGTFDGVNSGYTKSHKDQ